MSQRDGRRQTLRPISSTSQENVENSRKSLGPQRINKGSNVATSNQAPSKDSRKSMVPSASRRKSNVNENSSRQSIGHRQSIGRRSSIYGGRGGALKDPRNLTEKEERKSAILKIIQYVTDNGYDSPISYKLLTSPLMKDFLRIFQFLYNKLDPDYKFTLNYAEEIPVLMKELRYPFNINKSALLAWTPRTWPSLLGCLLWLCELCMYLNKVGADCYYPSIGDGFENDNEASRESEDQLFFEYLSNAYGSFMEGKDDFENMEDELTIFSAKNDTLTKDIEDMDVELEQQLQLLNEFKTNPCKKMALNARKDDFISDKKKFKKIVNGYETHLSSSEKKENDIQQILQEKESELQSLDAEETRLRRLLENQQLSQIDVERMNLEKKQFKDTLAEVQVQKNEIENITWEREREVNQKIQDLQTLLKQYHLQAETLQLIPATAKNANGIDFELCINTQDSAPETMLSNELKVTIKPSLIALKDAYANNLNRIQEQMIQLNEHLDGMNDVLGDKIDDIEVLRAKLAKVEAVFKDEKSGGAKKIKSRNEDVETLDEEVQNHKLKCKDTPMEKMQIEHEQNMRQFTQQKEELSALVYSAIDLVTSYKEKVNLELARLKKKCETLSKDSYLTSTL